MKKNIKAFTIVLIIVLFFSSCKKFVEVPIPSNQLVTSQVFNDSADATSAVLGIYIAIMQNRSFTITNGGVTLAGSLSSDDCSTTSTQASNVEVFNNSISIDNSFNIGLWNSAYSILYNINACIEGISRSATLSVQVKNRLLGESKLLRAFIYFNLVNLYGGVPIVTTTNYTTNQILPRGDISDVYSQILNDLNESKSLLTNSYISQYRSRPNQGAVSALLAKVYLYLKDWSKAESESNSILTSGVYSLDPNLSNVFVSGSNETIFAFQPASTIQTTWEGSSFVTSSSTSTPIFILTNTLLNAFEVNDKRKTSWIKQNIVNGTSYYYPYKYKIRITGPAPVENYVIFRLAEQYLIHAEAEAQLNNLPQAISDINSIRARAGLTPLVSSLTQSQVLAAIEQEREVELFAEWGNRWFDLKRWNKADAVLASIKGASWQSTDVLFPIPFIEILNNHYLSQNPGY
jgi:hypothetical protein